MTFAKIFKKVALVDGMRQLFREHPNHAAVL
jgi:hypothetical protein